ncbi:ribonuclease domain-containing protein [Janibacter limosus]|jgi:ribonuclease T1|uniref:ribonuclease domain-containing protein n=1 Tax=Janibacter limosus TaxID=53458 RepID=UPI0008353A67|nr:ribonuclease [Janibacter limosus]
MRQAWRTRLQLLGGFVLILLAAWIVLTGAPDDPPAERSGGTTSATSSAHHGESGSTPDGGSTPDSGLGTIAESALPAEGQETLDLIRSGGPFPYDRDGITFGNREGILPSQQRGYYREYTVPTPGLDHRGAKRIVCGEQHDCYFSSDHYESFRQIEEDQ